MSDHIVCPSFEFPDQPCRLAQASQRGSKLMTLPQELRDKILRKLLRDDEPIQYAYRDLDDDSDTEADEDSDEDQNMIAEVELTIEVPLPLQLLAVCQQMYEEARNVLYGGKSAVVFMLYGMG